MPRFITSRTEYYRDYYYKRKDLQKIQYYEKKLRREEAEAFFKEYGGEREYYKQKYLEFMSIGREKKEIK